VIELLTTERIRTAESAAIASGDVSGLELMDRAGRAVVEAILEGWPEMAHSPQTALVLCGPGNNGGDGFVVARLLHARGWTPRVVFLGDESKLPPDARAQCRKWREVGEIAQYCAGLPDNCDLYVDALFGIGLTRPVAGDYAAALADLRRTAGKTVAVDVPSGYCAESGRSLGANWFCDLCVTFEAPRVGHMLDPMAGKIGRLAVKSIGLAKYFDPSDAQIIAVAPCPNDGIFEYLGKKEFGRGGHKFVHGHALVMSGGSGRTGAARLAANGALRVGAGLVTLACPPAALGEAAAQVTEVMAMAVSDATALEAVLRDGRINALCVGPALGRTDEARDLVAMALKSGRATVLDADALSVFQPEPRDLFDMLHANVVLTPHGGEFARLFPDISERLGAPATKGPAYSKLDATRAAAKRAGCVVLLKGPDTVIADVLGRTAVHCARHGRAAPWLATAGSGDVLAGFITGLLARGFAPFEAAQVGAWLHVECARKFGPGLVANDLSAQLPAVFREMGL